MVLGEQLDRWFKKREQDRVDRAVAATIAKATAKATAETQRKWTEWNNRRMDAEAMGEPFDESPPSFDSASANGTQ
jgi:hypothetical protein